MGSGRVTGRAHGIPRFRDRRILSESAETSRIDCLSRNLFLAKKNRVIFTFSRISWYFFTDINHQIWPSGIINSRIVKVKQITDILHFCFIL